FDEHIGRIRRAARRADDGRGAVDGHRLAEHLAGAAVPGLELAFENPVAIDLRVYVGSTAVGAERAVFRRTDDHPVAVDGHRLAEALAGAVAIRRIEFRLLDPAAVRRIPLVYVDHAARGPVELRTHDQRVAADGGDRTRMLGFQRVRRHQLGLLRPGHHAVDGDGV